MKPLLICVYVSTFALISPIGAGIGIALSHNTTENLTEASLQSPLVTVLQALATGTLLYVVFFEVIEKERQKGTNGFLQVIHQPIKGSSINHVVKFLGTFDLPPPSWSLLLNWA